MMVKGVLCLRFFTNLSNILVALCSLVLVIFTINKLKKNKKIPDLVYLLKYIGTVSVSVTFITCVVLTVAKFRCILKYILTYIQEKSYVEVSVSRGKRKPGWKRLFILRTILRRQGISPVLMIFVMELMRLL